MKHASALIVSAFSAASFFTLAGCFAQPLDGDGHRSDSEIVFGIEQRKNADGKLVTAVGYEFLDVRSHGWSARGFVTDERSCWAERLDDRLGQPRVSGGVAKFEGGLLPAGGIAVVANRKEDLLLDAPAWANGGESLTFEARGFAMPDIRPSKLFVPSLDLAITSPAAPAATDAASASPELIVPAKQELEVTWTADANKRPESVVVSLVAAPEGAPSARGVELRCFFDRSAGKGRFPQKMMDRFVSLVGAGAVKGKLRIATHRQLTIFADGGWTVYVVASVDQREQPFALQR